ncbi:MAG: iron ABC transporter permease [Desulfobacterales bacterium C00003060]|nr:MAG: iron ABC transporter permease [Desulfobacterales bacterium S3730MH5]OEU77580.1 MAG: iron ABC transporter permease [Desulfobacterales bacterium C00003060]OEU83031.1 MAG: iron ABC transporter permease [Desulfobacterales bacterium S5133MH4]
MCIPHFRYFYMQEICEQYRGLTGRKVSFMILLVVLLSGVGLIALSQGASSVGLKDSFAALFEDSGVAHAIVWKLRLPRIVMAILVGCGLAIAGTVFQAILRNPLASPHTLGIGSSAGFGAVMAIVFGGGLYKEYLIAGNAFLFALLSSSLILGVAKLKRSTPETMILAGIAMMFFFSSLSSLFQYMGTMEEVHEIVFWFFGSLSKVGWKEISMASVMILLPIPLLLKWSWDFNLLAAGDESAKALGVNVTRIRMVGLVVASLITAGAICFTGVIGFIGLVSPHITRMVIGGDHRFLLPASALVGSVLVLTADTLGRTLWAPQVIPIGIVTSFIGVPFFFYLLMKRTREYW